MQCTETLELFQCLGIAFHSFSLASKVMIFWRLLSCLSCLGCSWLIVDQTMESLGCHHVQLCIIFNSSIGFVQIMIFLQYLHLKVWRWPRMLQRPSTVGSLELKLKVREHIQQREGMLGKDFRGRHSMHIYCDSCLENWDSSLPKTELSQTCSRRVYR